MTPREIEDEMVGSKKAIEDAVGGPVDAFAYPCDAYDRRVKQLARNHFELACSTELDFVTPGSDPLALERLDTYYLRRLRLVRRLFSGEPGAYLRLRRSARDLRASSLRSESCAQLKGKERPATA